MLKINIAQLVDAVQKAPAFELPEMNEGTSYLYYHIFCNLSKGKDVCLTDVEFSAFDLNDIHNLSDLNENVFEINHLQANGISGTLRKIAPICKASAYV